MLKKVIIPVAAFAITATSVSAFDLEALRSSDVNLSEAQIAAFEKVEALKEEGASRDEIESVLAQAGIDEDTMRDLRDEMHAAREASREAIITALDGKDYEAFLAAVAGSLMEGKIDTPEKFARLAEAHTLMAEARSIMEELDLDMMGGPGHGERDGQRHDWEAEASAS